MAGNIVIDGKYRTFLYSIIWVHGFLTSYVIFFLCGIVIGEATCFLCVVLQFDFILIFAHPFMSIFVLHF